MMRENVSKIAMTVASLFITAATVNMWLNDYMPLSLTVATVSAVVCWIYTALELRR